VVVETRFAAVFGGNPDVEAILEPSVRAIARWRPELILNLHGGTRSMALTSAAGARLSAGFAHFRGAALYNVRIPTAQEIFKIDLFHLGAGRRESPRARLVVEPEQTALPYAVLHPFASSPDKTWPAASFLAVAGHLQRRWAIEPVFVGAGGDDFSAFSRFRTVPGAPLERLKSLIAGAALFAGNDSGPAHIAAAFGVPLVVLFGNSDTVIWGPWKAPVSSVISRKPIASISTGEAIEAVDRLRVAA
jgi:ADP-heptose:LPS heptosyltransferase